jgi:aminoglycoside 6'-N-acetyltransferase I
VRLVAQVLVRSLGERDFASWQALRIVLWPDSAGEDHVAEMRAMLAEAETFAAFGAFDEHDALIGFAELSIRSIVDGAAHSPCGFLEGWYVVPEARRRGVGRALVDAGIAWLRARGVREIGSDTQLDNALSIAVHAALGFEETGRVVQFVRGT